MPVVSGRVQIGIRQVYLRKQIMTKHCQHQCGQSTNEASVQVCTSTEDPASTYLRVPSILLATQARFERG